MVTFLRVMPFVVVVLDWNDDTVTYTTQWKNVCVYVTAFKLNVCSLSVCSYDDHIAIKMSQQYYSSQWILLVVFLRMTTNTTSIFRLMPAPKHNLLQAISVICLVENNSVYINISTAQELLNKQLFNMIHIALLILGNKSTSDHQIEQTSLKSRYLSVIKPTLLSCYDISIYQYRSFCPLKDLQLTINKTCCKVYRSCQIK